MGRLTARLITYGQTEDGIKMYSMYYISGRGGTVVKVLCNKSEGRYSDWLQAGRSRIESRWGRDFPPIQTPVKWVLGLSRG